MVEYGNGLVIDRVVSMLRYLSPNPIIPVNAAISDDRMITFTILVVNFGKIVHLNIV